MELITGYSGTSHISGNDVARINSAVYSGENYIIGQNITYTLDIKDGQGKFTVTSGVALFSGRMVLLALGDSVTVELPDTATLYKKIILGIHYSLDTSTQQELCELIAVEGGPYSSVDSAKSAVLGTFPSTISTQTQTTNAFMPLWEIIVSGSSQVSLTQKYSLLKSFDFMHNENAEKTLMLQADISDIRGKIASEASLRSSADKTHSENLVSLENALDSAKLITAHLTLYGGGRTVISGSGSAFLLHLYYRSHYASIIIPGTKFNASGVDTYSLPPVVAGGKVYFAELKVTYNNDGTIEIAPADAYCMEKPGLSWELATDSFSVTVKEAYIIQSGAFKK